MANDLNINVKVNGVGEANENLKSIATQTKQTTNSLKDFEKVTRPLGTALTGIGVAGLAAAHATKDWNNTLGNTLQKLIPVFAALTGVGTALMVATKAVKAYRTAMAALQATTFSAAGVMGVFGASLGAVGLLVYGLSQIFPAVKADTERWNNALRTANDRLKELEENGQGSSDEAVILRGAIDDLTVSLSKFSDVGEDNIVTMTNLEDAVNKLADAQMHLNQINGDIPDTMQRAIDSGSNFGRALERIIGINVGDAATDVIELTAGIEALREEAEEPFNEAFTEAVQTLEEFYGLQANASKSLVQQLEDETEARQDALNEQLRSVKDNTDSVIKQYRNEYNARVMFLQAELDVLNQNQESVNRAREDADDAETQAELEAAVESAWNRKDRADAEEKLADFLEEVSRKKEDRVLEDQRYSLQQQIENTQNELNDKIEIENAKLTATEIVIQSELDALQNAANIKRSILQQELNDAVAVQNAIRNNAIAGINTQISAQLSAASVSSVSVSPIGAIAMQSGIDYENWAASSGGGTVTPTSVNNGVTVTGNTFVVRNDEDIPRIASELLRRRLLKWNMGS